MSLTVRLVLLAVFATLPAIAVEAYNQFEQRRAQTAEIHEDAEQLTRSAAAEMQHIVEGIERVSATLAQTPSVRHRNAAACNDLLVDLRQRVQPGQVEFGVADADGVVFCNGRSPGVVVRVKGAHFRRAMETGRFAVGGYAPSPTTDTAYLTFAYPVQDEEGRPTGAVLAGLDLTWLAEHMASRFFVLEGAFALTDRDFTYLVRLPDRERLVGTVAPERSRALATMTGKGVFEVTAQDGRTVITSILPLAFGASPAPDLLIAAALSKDAAFRALDAATRRGLALIVAGMLLAVLAASAAGHRFIRKPVAALLRTADRWRAGDYGARARLTDTSSEIGRLGGAFDAMAAQLERREIERRAAEAALRASEQRFGAIVKQAAVGISQTDLTGRFILANRRYCEIVGRSADELYGLRMHDITHPDDLPGNVIQFDRLVAEGQEYVIEKRYVRPDGSLVWGRTSVSVLHDQDGKPQSIVAATIDITESRRAEEHQKLLVDELSHRVKNTLASVQSIANQSLRNAASPEAFRDAFSKRLQALSQTHNLLSQSNWEGAGLRDVVLAELAPHRAAGGPRFSIEGEDVRLKPRAALSLGMAFHELATNAVKYGALSVPTGQIAIRWDTRSLGTERRLRIDWAETGGPPVQAPQRRGFGSTLIERGLVHELDGEVRLCFEPCGVRCSMEIPLGPH